MPRPQHVPAVRRSRSNPAVSRRVSASRVVVGLMSGTSADGIDAVAVRIHGHGLEMAVEPLWHHSQPYQSALRRRLLAVMAPAATRTEEIARLHAELGEAFADAVRAGLARHPGPRPTLIGLAGQTVCHLPGARGKPTVTLQLGNPAIVAARTGITTVAEFRQSDVAAGGAGAPLVPWTDWVLFQHPQESRIVLNIGGIANLTWLPAGGGPQDVIAFDTGPGNMILDGLVQQITQGRRPYDRDGRLARRGRVLPTVLNRWLRHPYLARKPPKTTGREMFGRPFIASELPCLKKASRDPADWLATAADFTARTIARACRRFLPGYGLPADRDTAVLVAGGGAKNPVLLGRLCETMPEAAIRPMTAEGVSSQSKEGLSFAMLAAARMDGVPANLPRVTGAGRPVLLGGVWLPGVAGPCESTAG